MKTRDIRANDLVTIRSDLAENDIQRIAKFARIVSEQKEMQEFTLDMLRFKRGGDCLVRACKATSKKPTEYALVYKDGVNIPIQTRYLTLKSRKRNHPLTSMFQEL